MKLHVFGCSFSVGSSFKHPALWKYSENWIDIVARGLKVHELENHSQFGVSNDYIFKRLIEESSNFCSGDYVIVQLTSGSRKWFFPNDPALSNITTLNVEAFSREQEKAIKSYVAHLQNKQLDDVIYTAYVYAIMYLIASKSNVNFIVIPGFSDFPGVNGNLNDNVCEAEFDSAETVGKFYSHHGWDPRLNHIMPENQTVLGEKVLEYFQQKKPLDLTCGFTAKIFTKDNFKLKTS